MCGLFGTHKSHKITTHRELRNLNTSLGKKSLEVVKEIVQVNKTKGVDCVEEYLLKLVEPTVNGYKKKIEETYREISRRLNNYFASLAEEVENDIQKYVNRVANDSSIDFSQLKKDSSKIKKEIDSLLKKNKSKKSNLFEVYNKLKKAEMSLNELKEQGKDIDSCVEEIKKLNVTIEYDKLNFLSRFKLKKNKLGPKKNMPTLLFKTISESFDSNLKNALDISASYEKENPTDLNISSDLEFSIKKSNSFFRNDTSKSLFNSNLFNEKRKETSQLFESAIIAPTVKNNNIKKKGSLSNRSLREVSLNRLSTKQSKAVSRQKNHLYRTNTCSIFTPQKKQINSNLKKMNVRELSPSHMNYEFSKKNTIVTIKGTTVSPDSFKRILNDIFTTRKIVEKLVFRENVFEKGVMGILKEFFKKSIGRNVKVDMRRNKTRFDSDKIEICKKALNTNKVRLLI